MHNIDAFVSKLGKKSILKKLISSLALPTTSPLTNSYTFLALLRITQDSDKKKTRLIKYHILNYLKPVLLSKDAKNYWLYHWALSLAHSLSLSDSLQSVLIENGFLFDFAVLAKRFYGIPSFQKMALHSIVRLLSCIDSKGIHKWFLFVFYVIEIASHLTDLEEIQFSLVICNALKNDDVELVCWAAFILHEYACKDVSKSVFVSSRGLIKSFIRLLTHEDTCIPRIVIRSLKNLAVDNCKFYYLEIYSLY